MKPTRKLSPAAAFFFKHAGWSYNPTTESAARGRTLCAIRLAEAESAGSAAGLTFAWEVDTDTDSSSWSDESPAWSLWVCTCLNADGNPLASLGGIDFGRDREPWGDPHQRVIEAELASEALKSDRFAANPLA